MKTNVDAQITINKVARKFPLVIDWEGVSTEDMRMMAQRSLVIRFANKHRTADKGNGRWPTEAECNIKAVDHRVGSRQVVERDPVKIVQAGDLSAAQLAELAALIAKKQAALKGADVPNK